MSQPLGPTSQMFDTQQLPNLTPVGARLQDFSREWDALMTDRYTHVDNLHGCLRQQVEDLLWLVCWAIGGSVSSYCSTVSGLLCVPLSSQTLESSDH